MNGVNVDPDSRELVRRFEDTTLPALSHEDHVRVAWAALAEAPLPVVMQQLPPKLRRYAASRGAPEHYHETITMAFLCLVHERLARTPLAWPAFAERYPELLDAGLLRSYYDDEVLTSPHARAVFVLPRRH